MSIFCAHDFFDAVRAENPLLQLWAIYIYVFPHLILYDIKRFHITFNLDALEEFGLEFGNLLLCIFFLACRPMPVSLLDCRLVTGLQLSLVS